MLNQKKMNLKQVRKKLNFILSPNRKNEQRRIECRSCTRTYKTR